METSLVLGWIFYALVAALFIGLIVLPCLRVLLIPEITGMETVDEVIDNLDLAWLVGNAGAGAICKIFQPLANGAANAYT